LVYGCSLDYICSNCCCWLFLMEVLIYLSIFSILLAFKLWWDWRAKTKKKRIINHFRSALIDGLVYGISGYLLFEWRFIGWFVLVIGLRWILFDFFFNLINGWEWNHYGSSSKLDKFLINLGDFHLLPKIGIIITGILLIIFT